MNAGRAAAVVILAAAASRAAGEEAPYYAVDVAASSAGFTLAATLHQVHGSGAALAGGFAVTGQEAGLLRLEGEVRAEAAGLRTGNEKRDRKMREQTLLVAEHPLFAFRPREARGDYPAGLAGDGEPRPMTLHGELEIRGVARDAAVPVVVTFLGDRLRVDGEFEIRLADHGIPDPSVFLLRVGKTVRASFHLEAVRSGSPPAGR